MSILGYVLTFYIILIALSAIGSLFLSVSRFSIGVRSFYIKFLAFIFDWSAEKCEPKSIPLDDDNSDEPAGQFLEVPGGRRRSRSHSGQTPSKQLSTKHLLDLDAVGHLGFWQKLQALSASQNETADVITVIAEETSIWTRWGLESIVTDEVTESFSVEELPVWNLLGRTDRGYANVSAKLFAVWLLGIFIRYFILFPVRALIFVLGMIFVVTSFTLVGSFYEDDQRMGLKEFLNVAFFRIMARTISLDAIYHQSENKATNGGICVANHTSPIDMVVLGADNYYALVGQKYNTGILGTIQNMLNKVTPHLWFNRENKAERSNVVQTFKDHTLANKPPILLFPEGVCVNNTGVMEFKKGAFEVGAKIYPAAICYDRRYGDPFWIQDTWGRHLFDMMTSWAIKCDIFYLPPVNGDSGESSIDFAQRVKKSIALRGGLVDVEWDGMVKLRPVRTEMVATIREIASRRIKALELAMESKDSNDKVDGIKNNI